jgi:hypothetical protein
MVRLLALFIFSILLLIPLKAYSGNGPPANDLCDDAQGPLSVPSTTAGTTVDATFDDVGFCGTSNTAPGVWYTVIGTGNTITLSTCEADSDGSADYDTKISVFCTGCDILNCVGGNDDSPNCGFPDFHSTFSFCSEAGVEYQILVHGFSSATGNFALDITEGSSCSGAVSCEPPFEGEVEKVYRQTDVCFEENNDGDLNPNGTQRISEDCVETSGEACEGPCSSSRPCVGGFCQVDNDSDGSFSEDCTECPGGTEPGTLLPEIGPIFQLNPVLKRNGRVASYNPGQYYAVSTVMTTEELDTLWIFENYHQCENNERDISQLNPRWNRGGGNVLLVLEESGVLIEVLNSKSDEITVDSFPDLASVHLEDVPDGSILHVYVKFKPGRKHQSLPTFPDNMCMNFNTAMRGAEIPPLCTPNSINCCSDHGGLGCDDPNCEAIVCSINPDCCNVAWNSVCRELAEDYCSISLESTPQTAKANLILGDGPPWLPAACNNTGTCLNFEPCNLSECGGGGGCRSLFEDTGGLGICMGLAGLFCIDFTDCPGGQSDCAEDEVCIINTCCPGPECLPIGLSCPSTGAASSSAESSSGPTFDSPSSTTNDTKQ